MHMIYIGLDVSKNEIDVCIKDKENLSFQKIANNKEAIQKWIKTLNQYQNIHACCEYTGIYYLEIAEALHQAKHQVSVINPFVIKSYANQKLRRAKTDKQDAKLIADYCQQNSPSLWKPIPEKIKFIKEIIKRIEQLTKMRTSEMNRKKVSFDETLPLIQDHIHYLNRQIDDLEKRLNELISSDERLLKSRDLLLSIPGFGIKTANILLPILAQVHQFESAKKLVSYLGLSPTIHQSGSSVYRKSRISKMGNPFIRKSLFIPARTVCLRSKLFKNWAKSLMDKGKAPKLVYTIMMRKLVVYAYTIIKSDKPFSDKYIFENNGLHDEG